MTKVGIIGTGSVATNLATGLLRARHEVVFGSRNPGAKPAPVRGARVGTQREAAQFGEVVALAVPFGTVRETVQAIGADTLEGKILLDATNALGGNGGWAVGFETSGAEQLAKLAPGAKVVKAFNSVFAQNMATGRVGNEPLAAFVASDDARAKETVMDLAKSIGFDPIDAGGLASARYLEPMAVQLITLGYGLKMGPGIGFRLVR